MTESSPSTVTFDTELGQCAVRWSDAGITGVLLPKAGGRPGPVFEEGAAVPRFVAEAIKGIQAVMAGEARDLRDVSLDERGVDDWRRTVYAATREIPAGTTRSYGELAKAIGRDDFEGARDVGAALARNPVVMLAWGVIVAVLLALGMALLFVGLAVVLPWLGHATWHLYRRLVG